MKGIAPASGFCLDHPMRGWLFPAALTLAGLLEAFSPVIADAPAPAKSVRVMFFGYQMLNGTLAVQIHISDAAAADQPGLPKTGDHFNLGPLGAYTVGAIHHTEIPVVNPGSAPILPDTTTVDIVDASGHKTTLKFRTATEIKAQPAS
jgi:hypothetical protein